VTHQAAIPVDGTVDRVRRLKRDPPVEWDRTAWGIETIEDGDTLLVEAVIVDCPDCGELAFWAGGFVDCRDCETRQRLVG